MKSVLVYLDFDGVLNDCGGGYHRHDHPHARRILPRCAEVLQGIVQECERHGTPQGVICSAWREAFYDEKKFHPFPFTWMLRTHGINLPIVGAIERSGKDYSGATRIKLIEKHRAGRTPVIIIDDSVPRRGDIDHMLIKPEPQIGLERVHIVAAMRLLEGQRTGAPNSEKQEQEQGQKEETA